MKLILIFFLGLSFSTAMHASPFGEDQEVPPIDDTPADVQPGGFGDIVWPTFPFPKYPNDLPQAGYGRKEPPMPVITGYLPKRVPWTDRGDHFIRDYVLQVCQGETPYRCEVIASHQPQRVNGDLEWGLRIYRKDNGAYLGTVDRNVGEEITRDDEAISIDAHNRHPESAYIARMESDKAKLEYIAAACATGAVYCTSMAAKMESFKTLFTTACSVWSGLCMNKVADMKLQFQQRIDYVKQQCSIGDQACFDAVTNNGETRARAEYSRKYGNVPSGSGATPGGERPPHESGRPKFDGTGDPYEYYDPSCKHCTITESDPDGKTY